MNMKPARYRITPEAFFRFLGSGMVEVRATKKLLLPQEIFRVLTMFEEPRTIDEAAAHAATPREAISDAVAMLVDRELLTIEAPSAPSPETPFAAFCRHGVFDDESSIATMARHLGNGRALVIPDVLRADVAERVYEELSSDDLRWQSVEELDQIAHFRFRSLDLERHLPPSALALRAAAAAPTTKALMSRLTDRDCSGVPEFSASWYRPGDYTHPHDDAQPHRSVVAVLNLSKNWRPEWGGSLFWAPSGASIEPRFNTMTLFVVRRESVHQVIPVSPLAQAKRLTLNIWWTNRTPPPPIDKTKMRTSRADESGVTPSKYGASPEPLAHRIVAL